MFKLNNNRTIHSFKTAFACLIGLVIARLFTWQASQWIPITIMVVMSAQAHFGAALQKAYMRLLGTIVGVIITVITLLAFGNDIVVVFLVIFVACTVFTYIASSSGDISYAGTLGGVTVILTLTGQHVGVEYAAERGLYIVIGIVIALLVSRLIFPIHARARLRCHVATTLRNLQKLYFKATQLQTNSVETVIDEKLENILTMDLIDQPRLIHEACLGSRAFAAKKDLFIEIVNIERRINRLITLLYRGLFDSKLPNPIAIDLQLTVENEFEKLASGFESESVLEDNPDFVLAFFKVQQVIENLPKNADADRLIAEYSFLFALEQIFKELQSMRQLIIKINGNGLVKCH